MMTNSDTLSGNSKILLITASFSPRIGGLETVVTHLASCFAQSGHHVVVVTNRYPNNLPKKEVIEGIQVERLQFLYPGLKYIKTGRLDLWLAGIFYFPYTLLKLGAIILRFCPDVVNLHYLGDLGFFVLALHYALRFRFVVSLHGGDVDGEPHQNRLKRWLFGAVVERAEKVTACSQALLDRALALTPEIRSKAKVIHNGVDTGLFANAKPFYTPRPYIFAVGQLAFHKGFDILITAFTQVSRHMLEVDLLIAGDGYEKDSLYAQIGDNGLNGRVQLLGSVNRKRVAELMQGSLAVIIPSRRDAFGIVGLEAMASGKPIIASQVDGLTEALADAVVDWFLPEDYNGLATALLTLIHRNYETSSIPILQANQLKVKSHSWQRVGSQYLDIYR